MLRTFKVFLLSYLVCSYALASNFTALPLRNAHAEPSTLYMAWANTQTAPTVLALHGCGGMLNAAGKPNARSQIYAALLNAQGWHVAFLDGFTARGIKSICGAQAHDRATVSQAQRLADTQAALLYLAQHHHVNAQRIALLGWSHGGSAVLQASHTANTVAIRPVAAVAFYPGCGPASVPRHWQPAWPVLLQLGQLDDWTNPAPCEVLAKRWSNFISWTTYPNAYHGFDSDTPVVQLSTVTSRSTGKGVHVGGSQSQRQLHNTLWCSF